MALAPYDPDDAYFFKSQLKCHLLHEAFPECFQNDVAAPLIASAPHTYRAHTASCLSNSHHTLLCKQEQFEQAAMCLKLQASQLMQQGFPFVVRHHFGSVSLSSSPHWKLIEGTGSSFQRLSNVESKSCGCLDQ